MIKVNEVFFSIQGESTRAGMPTVFVRTSGCPHRCTYCDTEYAFYHGEKYDTSQVIKKVDSFDTNFVCITGGEPLVQKDVFELMTKLCDLGKEVSLETSGSISCQEVDSRVKKVLDVKTPSSGAAESFLLKNLNYLNPNDEIKFVICDESDFIWASEFISSHRVFEKCVVLMSPSHGRVSAQWLAEKILSENPKVRLQMQMHKYIWTEQENGF